VKIVKIEISGTPTPGDVVNVWCRAKRGGKTEAGYLVKKDDDLPEIAAGLAGKMNANYCRPLFDAQAKGAHIDVICSDDAADVTFGWDVEHVVEQNHLVREPGGTEVVTIEE
jgi:hypothetical protein